jgi:hypothetical protein
MVTLAFGLKPSPQSSLRVRDLDWITNSLSGQQIDAEPPILRFIAVPPANGNRAVHLRRACEPSLGTRLVPNIYIRIFERGLRRAHVATCLRAN